MKVKTLPIRPLIPGQPIPQVLSLDDLEEIGCASGSLAARLPLISLQPRERQRLRGYLFPFCDGFVTDVAEAAIYHPDLFGAGAPSPVLRIDGPALLLRQRRATAFRVLAARFTDLAQVCEDLYLREQSEGVQTSMAVMREVRARYASPYAELADRQRECMLWSAAKALSSRSPRPKREPPATPEAKEAARQKKKRRVQAARDRSTLRAREVIADVMERLKAEAERAAAAPPAPTPVEE